MPQNYVPIFIFLGVIAVLLPLNVVGGEVGSSRESQPHQADAVRVRN
jgi:hypothetical protein